MHAGYATRNTTRRAAAKTESYSASPGRRTKARITRAQEVLSTQGIQDTIDRALEEVLRADLRRRLADRIWTGEGIDRGNEILEASRSIRWSGGKPKGLRGVTPRGAPLSKTISEDRR